MHITWKGTLDGLVPAQRKKVDAKLGKLAKLVDGRQEREAHVILTTERHVHRTEITVSLHDHVMVGVGHSADMLTSVTTAVDKLEKQIRKLQAKKRDTKRGPDKSLRVTSAVAAEEIPAGAVGGDRPVERCVFRADQRANQKPLTLEEALLEVEDGRDYLVYRDAETGRVSVLLRRRDGHFDLVQA